MEPSSAEVVSPSSCEGSEGGNPARTTKSECGASEAEDGISYAASGLEVAMEEATDALLRQAAEQEEQDQLRRIMRVARRQLWRRRAEAELSCKKFSNCGDGDAEFPRYGARSAAPLDADLEEQRADIARLQAQLLGNELQLLGPSGQYSEDAVGRAEADVAALDRAVSQMERSLAAWKEIAFALEKQEDAMLSARQQPGPVAVAAAPAPVTLQAVVPSYSVGPTMLTTVSTAVAVTPPGLPAVSAVVQAAPAPATTFSRSISERTLLSRPATALVAQAAAPAVTPVRLRPMRLNRSPSPTSLAQVDDRPQSSRSPPSIRPVLTRVGTAPVFPQHRQPSPLMSPLRQQPQAQPVLPAPGVTKAPTYDAAVGDTALVATRLTPQLVAGTTTAKLPWQWTTSSASSSRATSPPASRSLPGTARLSPVIRSPGVPASTGADSAREASTPLSVRTVRAQPATILPASGQSSARGAIASGPPLGGMLVALQPGTQSPLGVRRPVANATTPAAASTAPAVVAAAAAQTLPFATPRPLLGGGTVLQGASLTLPPKGGSMVVPARRAVAATSALRPYAAGAGGSMVVPARRAPANGIAVTATVPNTPTAPAPTAAPLNVVASSTSGGSLLLPTARQMVAAPAAVVTRVDKIQETTPGADASASP
eukprot:TRINITY_DN41753_c0_g1_i1.p1 TRINITY_DN41753_c0_g1~~TRINITY_DN41753_c0_g1_i1.p1  ORF type:complete len:656 (-),score=138.60 TRINITY_DN41753_c0_g1_i1:84-2051(-)